MKLWDVVGLSIAAFVLIGFIFYQIGHFVR